MHNIQIHFFTQMVKHTHTHTPLGPFLSRTNLGDLERNPGPHLTNEMGCVSSPLCPTEGLATGPGGAASPLSTCSFERQLSGAPKTKQKLHKLFWERISCIFKKV